jgi:hypothetical protein
MKKIVNVVIVLSLIFNGCTEKEEITLPERSIITYDHNLNNERIITGDDNLQADSSKEKFFSLIIYFFDRNGNQAGIRRLDNIKENTEINISSLLNDKEIKAGYKLLCVKSQSSECGNISGEIITVCEDIDIVFQSEQERMPLPYVPKSFDYDLFYGIATNPNISNPLEILKEILLEFNDIKALEMINGI